MTRLSVAMDSYLWELGCLTFCNPRKTVWSRPSFEQGQLAMTRDSVRAARFPVPAFLISLLSLTLSLTRANVEDSV